MYVDLAHIVISAMSKIYHTVNATQLSFKLNFHACVDALFFYFAKSEAHAWLQLGKNFIVILQSIISLHQLHYPPSTLRAASPPPAPLFPDGDVKERVHRPCMYISV